VSFLKNLGAKVELSKAYIDHHRYTLKEVEKFIRQSSRRGIQAILTTEKDAVRIPRIVHPKIPIYSLRVEIEILRGDDNWQKFISRLTSPQRIQAPQKFF
jgi:tetraacyldisaccharide 4'-kinase